MYIDVHSLALLTKYALSCSKIIALGATAWGICTSCCGGVCKHMSPGGRQRTLHPLSPRKSSREGRGELVLGACAPLPGPPSKPGTPAILPALLPLVIPRDPPVTVCPRRPCAVMGGRHSGEKHKQSPQQASSGQLEFTCRPCPPPPPLTQLRWRR